MTSFGGGMKEMNMFMTPNPDDVDQEKMTELVN